MNINEFMQQMMDQEQAHGITITEYSFSQEELQQRIDTFIQRCYDEKGYDPVTLHNDIVRALQVGWCHPKSIAAEFLPMILNELRKGV